MSGVRRPAPTLTGVYASIGKPRMHARCNTMRSAVSNFIQDLNESRTFQPVIISACVPLQALRTQKARDGFIPDYILLGTTVLSMRGLWPKRIGNLLTTLDYFAGLFRISRDTYLFERVIYLINSTAS